MVHTHLYLKLLKDLHYTVRFMYYTGNLNYWVYFRNIKFTLKKKRVAETSQKYFKGWLLVRSNKMGEKPNSSAASCRQIGEEKSTNVSQWLLHLPHWYEQCSSHKNNSIHNCSGNEHVTPYCTTRSQRKRPNPVLTNRIMMPDIIHKAIFTPKQKTLLPCWSGYQLQN